jgi:hypothetical protein
LAAGGAEAALLSAGVAIGAPVVFPTLGSFSASADSAAGGAGTDADGSPCIALKANTAAPATATRIKSNGTPTNATTSAELDRERACGRVLKGTEAGAAYEAGAAGLAALGGKGEDIGAGTDSGGIVPPSAIGAAAAAGTSSVFCGPPRPIGAVRSTRVASSRLDCAPWT